jgi:hypothetical protein
MKAVQEQSYQGKGIPALASTIDVWLWLIINVVLPVASVMVTVHYNIVHYPLMVSPRTHPPRIPPLIGSWGAT